MSHRSNNSKLLGSQTRCILAGLAGLQAAIDKSEMVRGLVLLNISLRMLHITKQEWWKKPFVKALQNVLRGTNLGQAFFKSVASKKAVKNILQQVRR
jgi:hypothetical protein